MSDNKKLFIVETISQFRMCYYVEAETADKAKELVLDNDSWHEEFGQYHVGESVFSTREVTQDQYIEQYDELAGVYKDISVDRKLSFLIREGKVDNE